MEKKLPIAEENVVNLAHKSIELSNNNNKYCPKFMYKIYLLQIYMMVAAN